MGAKWGLVKFPLDPEVGRPSLGLELDWRAQSMEAVEAQAGMELSHSPEKMAWVFDLSLPLAPQLDLARIRLVARKRHGEDGPSAHSYGPCGLGHVDALARAAGWRRRRRVRA